MESHLVCAACAVTPCHRACLCRVWGTRSCGFEIVSDERVVSSLAEPMIFCLCSANPDQRATMYNVHVPRPLGARVCVRNPGSYAERIPWQKSVNTDYVHTAA